MLKFEYAEELQKLAANCVAKGLVVRHPSELQAIADASLIEVLANHIEDTHEGLRKEMSDGLSSNPSKLVRGEYLTELKSIFINSTLSPALAATVKLRAELENEARHTNPAQVTMAEGVHTVAVFQVKSICLLAAQSPEYFGLNQRLRLGQLYLIATRADESINDILREIDRQERYLSFSQSEEQVTNQVATIDSRGGDGGNSARALYYTKGFDSDLCDKMAEDAKIIHSKANGYGFMPTATAGRLCGFTQALIKNDFLMGEAKHSLRALANKYKVSINKKGEYPDKNPNGSLNLTLRDGRIQTEQALIDEGLLPKGGGFYHNRNR